MRSVLDKGLWVVVFEGLRDASTPGGLAVAGVDEEGIGGCGKDISSGLRDGEGVGFVLWPRLLY
jgi:hypothetical protein